MNPINDKTNWNLVAIIVLGTFVPICLILVTYIYCKNINLCMKNGIGPLYIACQNGYKNIVELLLSKDANINVCTEKGISPLFIASQSQQESIVELLLSKGADINLCSKDGTTPLDIASQQRHKNILNFLQNNGGKHGYVKTA
uniref:Ankyrin-3 n=1 Tax=Magallana gigas TaxID=29159 RepID=K1R9D1_MAGGI